MKQVISCSRRTDVPRVYHDWLSASLEGGRAEYLAPRGGGREISLQPDDVHSLVFWSKDYRFFLDHEMRKRLDLFNLYFHFTLTGLGGSFWEPGAPPAAEGLLQARQMVSAWGPDRVNWRFDPIIFWEDGREVYSNVDHFWTIAPRLADMGIDSCTVSFAQVYPKIGRRLRGRGVALVDPELDAKRETLNTLSGEAISLGMTISTCALDSSVWDDIPGVHSGRCIDGDGLSELHPQRERAESRKDASQRRLCDCTASVDIGSYAQPCSNSCLYCYATPANLKAEVNEAGRASA